MPPAEESRAGFAMPTSGREARRGETEPEAPEEAAESEQSDDGPLPDDATVDVQAERQATAVDEVLERLDRELVGLVPVKTRIRQIAALLLVDRMRQRFGLSTSRPTLHMSFTGPPGTGKTTVAMRMAELLSRLGYLSKGHLVAVTRDDLVGQYIGHTAPKTKEVLKRSMGGVLFIDEAYYLHREESERDYGQESIEILLQIMENQREDVVVILAGYADRMEKFFAASPGFSSRIAHHIDFPDYSLDELMAISELMLKEENYELSPEARETFREYMARRKEQPRFANARSVRNALERARLRHASRILDDSDTPLGKADLMRLEPVDFRASRVFDEDEDGQEPRAAQQDNDNVRADAGSSAQDAGE